MEVSEVAMTIRDIAREAGVSTATVSRALRGLPNVDPTTRHHVKSVADRMNYVISPTASRLATGRTRAIAVITPFVSRWYFATVLSGAERVFHEADFDLLLFGTGEPSEPHRVPSHRRLRHKADGFLVLNLDPEGEDVAGLFDLDLPIVLVGVTSPKAVATMVDDVAGARTATQHLIDLGHRDIGIISGRQLPSPFTPDLDRYDGFLQALTAAGIAANPDFTTYGSFTMAGGEEAMERLLRLPRRPTAVFAISDEMAFGAIRALRRNGLTPGREVSLVGYDGHELAELMNLTTVIQPVEQLGVRGAELMLERLSDPSLPVREIIYPIELAVRSSTGPLNGGS
jgi:LacI family transcriptional regulator, repressor for deo operon, udp, cdd, tsx, nupC, and nupG